MDDKTHRWCASRATVFKALGHPTRVFIVQELSKGEECVCHLTEKIGADISTVSKHLAILKSAGIVSDDKRGLQVFYKLRMPCVLGVFGCVDKIMAEDLRDRESLIR
ncbi:MAG: winged helix-turn-helix transcriptional regulator [Candidatus Hydrogenedentes bacterium]|nr:winged helix-turn-helix transcriptional regulator [Candidatus Hydrogenedentota bacterium]